MGKLQFIIGDAGCNHYQAMIELVRKWQETHSGSVFFIVPNNLKYELEIHVLSQLSQDEEPASIDTQVFSFSRLAWYLLQQINEVPKPELSMTGMQMILRQLLKQYEEELVVFRGEMKKTGFIEKLADLIIELRSAQIMPADLQKLTAQEEQAEFNDKMHDFALIYEAFLQATAAYSSATDTSLDLLMQHLADFQLQNCLFVVTGFHHFAAQEQELLLQLLAYSDELIVDLILDCKYITESPSVLNLFYPTATIYQRLYQQARSKAIPVLIDVKAPAAKESQGMTAVNCNWQAMQNQSQDAQPFTEDIHFWKTATIQEEVEQVAAEIKRLVAKGYNYRDIVVLTRDLPNYGLIIPALFNQFAIPYNISQSQSMMQHPLTVLLDSLFALVKNHYRYRDVMRFLRTELVTPYAQLVVEDQEQLADYQKEAAAFRRKIDLTENVMLAYGYEGSAFSRTDDWKYVNYNFEDEKEDDRDTTIQAETNEVRRFVRDQIQPFKESLLNARTGAEAAQIVYQFLVTAGVNQQLLNWRYQAQSNGDLMSAKAQEQTWNTLMDLLDEYVELLGQQPFDLDEFTEILLQGMEGATYSQVPTTLDQVSVMDVVRRPAVRRPIVFILGATNSNLPKKVENKTLLSDRDRQTLDAQLSETQYLLQDSKQQMANEPFFAYLAMMTASQKLYVTYPQDSEVYAGADISPYVKRLLALGESSLHHRDSHLNYNQFEADKVATKRQFISQFVLMERKARLANEPVNRNWQSVARIVNQDETLAPLMKQVLTSLEHRNETVNLPMDLVESLYGKTMYSSVSRFETFYQCSYRYYLQYGLKLQERDQFALSSIEMGEFFHETLDQLVRKLDDSLSKVRLANYSDEELQQVAGQVMEDILNENKYLILQQSKHMVYIRRKLQKIIYRVIWAMRRQSQHNQGQIRATELLFGQLNGQKGLDKTLKLHLDRKHELRIRGKIDRIDTFTAADKTYMTIIDYKSSAHRFNFSDAYYGLAMQLLTYLDVAIANSEAIFAEQVIPAGAMYFWLHNPTMDLANTQTDDDYRNETLKDYKQKGILLNDEAFLAAVDSQIEPGLSGSKVADFKMKKSGEYYGDTLLTSEEMSDLLLRNEDNFIQAGQSIYRGEVEINPYRYDKQSRACTYCPFRSICQFDPLMPENNYRQLEKLKQQDVMERLKGDEE